MSREQLRAAEEALEQAHQTIDWMGARIAQLEEERTRALNAYDLAEAEVTTLRQVIADLKPRALPAVGPLPPLPDEPAGPVEGTEP